MGKSWDYEGIFLPPIPLHTFPNHLKVDSIIMSYLTMSFDVCWVDPV